MATTIIISIIAVIVIIYVLSGFTIVQQSSTKVIERLGKYSRTLNSGINIVLPIIEKARIIKSRVPYRDASGNERWKIRSSSTIDLREQVFDFPGQNVITKDNVSTIINALIYFQITDPFKSVYEIENLPNAIETLTQTTLRNVIGEMKFDETLTSRDTINSRIRAVLDDATNKWGVKVNRVELQDIIPPMSVKEAMEKEMKAEREKRALILSAEGEKQAAILKSEGEKASLINQSEAEKQSKILKAQADAEAKLLQAQAEAEAIAKITGAISGMNMSPATYMLAEKYIEALKEMASGKDSKVVYMPYEASSMMSSIGCFQDMFKEHK